VNRRGYSVQAPAKPAVMSGAITIRTETGASCQGTAGAQTATVT
jgi:hypothetical protein